MVRTRHAGVATLAEDVAQYESWLRTQCEVVKDDLEYKHKRMRKSAFVFLRATYFRWARIIEAVCPGFEQAPHVLCVGDTHVENFGTWRDGDARHVWGVNDFDEAAVMPYAYDLIRLVTSARLSPQLAVSPKQAAEAVLKGYIDALGTPGPVLLDEGAAWCRTLVHHLDDTTKKFWKELDKCHDAVPPRQVRRALESSLPVGASVQRFAARLRKGGGGLGRPRFVVIADWQGGRIVREAKAMVPSAWNWAHSKGKRSPRFLELAFGAHRSPDPSLLLAHRCLLRRLAPDARKLDLQEVAARGLGFTLLEAMGAELGSIHAAHPQSDAIIDDLGRRDGIWLHLNAQLAQQAVEKDFRAWRR
jgi:hypothetical protein